PGPTRRPRRPVFDPAVGRGRRSLEGRRRPGLRLEQRGHVPVQPMALRNAFADGEYLAADPRRLRAPARAAQPGRRARCGADAVDVTRLDAQRDRDADRDGRRVAREQTRAAGGKNARPVVDPPRTKRSLTITSSATPASSPSPIRTVTPRANTSRTRRSGP